LSKSGEVGVDSRRVAVGGFLTVGLTGVGLALSQWPAHASLPGRNGLIAFTQVDDGRNQIHVMNADGTGQRNLSRNAAQDSNPAWSADGARIAYTCIQPGRSDHDVCVMDADGSHQRDLTSGSTAEESFPSWSAKPPFTIVFQSNRGKADVNDNDLYVMTADGRRATPLATTTAREEQPAWAAGIDKIA
jgi:TolB protein